MTSDRTVNTFSGAHPFRPACLIRAYEREELDDMPSSEAELSDLRAEAVKHVANLVATYVDQGRCPRCATAYEPREIPSGSRLTECRCIPICAQCSRVEPLIPMVVAEIEGPDDRLLVDLLAPVSEWPIDPATQSAGLSEFNRRHPPRPAFLADDSGGRPVLISERGVGDLWSGLGTGWVAHGYDDTDDRDELNR